MSNGMLDAALTYIKRGIPVFPVRRDNKRPMTEHGFYDATTDEEQVRAWFTNPIANIAVPTGKKIGLLAIDIDPRHGGEETFARIMDNQTLPEGPVTMTGGGGKHIWFKHDKRFTIGAGKNDLLGVDFRGGGGYVVVAPSIHDSGNPYIGEVPDPARAPEIPEWLAAAILKSKKSKTETGLGGPKIGPGTMNDTLFRIAVKLRKQGWELDDILQHLLYVAKTRCDPPIDLESTEQIAKIAGIAERAASYERSAEIEIAERRKAELAEKMPKAPKTPEVSELPPGDEIKVEYAGGDGDGRPKWGFLNPYWFKYQPTKGGEEAIAVVYGDVQLLKTYISPEKTIFVWTINGHEGMGTAEEFKKRLREEGAAIKDGLLTEGTAMFMNLYRGRVPNIDARPNVALVLDKDGSIIVSLDAVGGVGRAPTVTKILREIAERTIDVQKQLEVRNQLRKDFYRPWEWWGSLGFALGSALIPILMPRKKYYFTAIDKGPPTLGKDALWAIQTELFVGNPRYAGSALGDSGKRFRVPAVLSDSGFAKLIDEGDDFDPGKYADIIKIVGSGATDFRGRQDLGTVDLTSTSGVAIVGNSISTETTLRAVRKRLVIFDHGVEDEMFERRMTDGGYQNAWQALYDQLVPGVGLKFFQWFAEKINAERGTKSADQYIIEETTKVRSVLDARKAVMIDPTRVYPYSTILYMLGWWDAFCKENGIDMETPQADAFVQIMNILERMTKATETEQDVLIDAIERYVSSRYSTEGGTFKINPTKGVLYLSNAGLKDLAKIEPRIPKLYPKLAEISKRFKTNPRQTARMPGLKGRSVKVASVPWGTLLPESDQNVTTSGHSIPHGVEEAKK